MPLDPSHAATVPDDVDVVGVPVAEDAGIIGEAHGLDPDELEARGFEAKVGETTSVTVGGTTVVAVGVGEAASVTLDVLRRAAGALVRSAWKRSAIATTLLDAVPEGLDRPSAAQAVAEGAKLASYRFTMLKSDPKPCLVERFVVAGKGGQRVARGVERGAIVARGVTLARDLVNTPPGRLRPADLAKAAVDVGGQSGLEVEVIDEKQAKKLGLGGLLGVGQGSDNPPRMVRLTYDPGNARSTVALVGKGITFDSGGLSIKTAEGMMTMKTDMSGAAAVLGAMSVLPALAPRTRVVGFLCAAENMPSGAAIRPGDVLDIRNGKTVEVLNTDAEGRLVMADGLSLAVEEGPDAIVDLATLTGACMIALGPKVAGLMGNHDDLVEQVRAAGGRAGEPLWHLPLPREYRKMLDSDVADVKNIGDRYGGALTAGLFLQEFVDDRPWVHLDIAGPANAGEDDTYVAKGGTGFGVRTVVELVTSFRKPKGAGQRAGQEPARA